MPTRLLAATCLSSALALGQTSVVLPNVYSHAEAPSSTGYPWARGAGATRVLYVHDSQLLLQHQIDHAIAIRRLRWRANGAAGNGGGQYTQVTVALSTAAVDHLAVTPIFAQNHGADLTTVHQGPVVVQPATGTSPNNFYVEVVLNPPFVYDPTMGDLAIDLATDGSGWSGAPGANLDSAGSAGLGARVYHLSDPHATVGTTQIGSSPILEIAYDPVPGVATVSTFGSGCPAGAPLELAVAGRPITGRTVDWVTSGIPPYSPLGALVLGLSRTNPAVDLGAIGMPGCLQFVDGDASAAFLITAETMLVPLTIPNLPSLAGVTIHAQAVTLSLGFNPLGFLTSNGATLVLGTR